MSREYHDGDEFRHIATSSLERDAHYGIRDPDGVAEDGSHPRRQVGRYRDPYHAHDERYRIPISPSFIPAVWHGDKQHQLQRPNEPEPDFRQATPGWPYKGRI